MNEFTPMSEWPRVRMVKHMRLAKTSTAATTYEFVVDGDFGWAICTVNDATGELIVTSDWGNWTYRWSPNPSHLGAATLTHFLGNRSDVGYLVDKLLGRRRIHEFSAEATCEHLMALVTKRRWTDGQEFNQRMRERLDDYHYYGGGRYKDATEARESFAWDLFNGTKYNGSHYLTKDTARTLHDELGGPDLWDCTSEEVFIERLYRLDGFNDICEEPYNETQHRESNDARILRETILPALVEACIAKVQDPHAEFVIERDKKTASAEMQP